MKSYQLKINGKNFDVVVDSCTGEEAQVQVNGVSYCVHLTDSGAQESVHSSPSVKAPLSVSGPAPARKSSGKHNITSPLPGTIIKIFVEKGMKVKRGDKLAVIEAMKMENDILCGTDGTVEEIKVTTGDSILEGAIIAVIV